jgi:hypothetical protein
MTKHNHHKCECKHENLAYCKKCDTAYCQDCPQEWKPECRQAHYPYYWFGSDDRTYGWAKQTHSPIFTESSMYAAIGDSVQKICAHNS